ncbi:MAG: hypothetical protein ACFFBC_01155 [Promethearchaeota archaeon]
MTKNSTTEDGLVDRKHLFSEKLRNYEDKIVDFIVDIGKRKRVNPKMLQISSYLFVHGGLTQKELQELTGFSMGTISTFLSVMIGMGRFQKERIPKTHTFKYSYSGTLEEMTTSGIDIMISSLSSMDVYLNSKKKDLKRLIEQNKKGAEHLSQRIDELLDIFDFYKTEFYKPIT